MLRTCSRAATGFASVFIALFLGCASTPEGEKAAARPGYLPASHEECVAAGGDVDRASQGGRCFFYTTPRKDPSAYIRCRDSGGVMGVRGRGMARETRGQSHVCTLTFDPEPFVPAD